jgi:glycosyltransferase involved in cell wall biosynthesis
MESLNLSRNQGLNTSTMAALPPDVVAKASQHICVCICTYKRPQLLRRLLGDLADQETNGLFSYSIVVADNDHLRSAEAVVKDFAAVATNIPVKYCMQPQQNISLTRNKAIEKTSGDFIAFIDDDEFPTKRWLFTMFEACNKFNADGVLGPVKPYFEEKAPKWVVRGKFYERPTYATGFVIDWRKGRTGNVLLKKLIFEGLDQPFSPKFHVGEDQDFFRRMIAKGYTFIWCNEAVAFEAVPPVRWSRTFMLKRALLRGTCCLQHPVSHFRIIATSVLAIPIYAAALPFTLALGHHRFMTLLVKLFDHLGRLLAFVGLKPVTDQYVTE